MGNLRKRHERESGSMDPNMWFFSFRGPSDDFARFIYGSDMDDLVYERKTRQHYGAKVSRIRKHNGKITDRTRLPVGRMA